MDDKHLIDTDADKLSFAAQLLGEVADSFAVTYQTPTDYRVFKPLLLQVLGNAVTALGELEQGSDEQDAGKN